MNKIKNTLNLGLQTTLPIIVTIAILVWLIGSVEAFFGFFIKIFIPAEYYFTGMGAFFGLGLVFLVGFLMNAWAVSTFYSWIEEWVKRVPLVKSIYQAIQDIMALFDANKGAELGHTVIVETPYGRVIGFITRVDYGNLELGEHAADEVVVYVPISYQFGGIMVLISKSKLKLIDMAPQDAMRFVLTAGVGKEKHHYEKH